MTRVLYICNMDEDKKKVVKYIDTLTTNIVEEPAVAYGKSKSPLQIVKSLSDDDKYGYLKVVKSGLTYAALEDFMSMSALHLEDMSAILHVNSRTLRRFTSDQLLSLAMSEKLVSLLRLYKLGHEVFGNADIFNDWMRRPVRGLGYELPLTMLVTAIGTEIVSDELVRLSYGVYN